MISFLPRNFKLGIFPAELAKILLSFLRELIKKLLREITKEIYHFFFCFCVGLPNSRFFKFNMIFSCSLVGISFQCFVVDFVKPLFIKKSIRNSLTLAILFLTVEECADSFFHREM
jgi:hypothetical protein